MSAKILRLDRIREECVHSRITVKAELNGIYCSDCNLEIDPLIWIISLATGGKEFFANYKGALEKYKSLTKITCQHCGEIIPLPPLEAEN